MTSQQDTELSRILQNYKEYLTGVYQGIADYDEETAIQALTSWKDKEVTKARIDELRHLRIPTQTLRDQVDDRIKSLQSQGGKGE